MSKDFRPVLMHHPCIYEEVVKDICDPNQTFEFKEWDLFDDPQYMLDPVAELLWQLHERSRARRLQGQTKLLGLMDALDNPPRPKLVETIKIPQLEVDKNMWPTETVLPTLKAKEEFEKEVDVALKDIWKDMDDETV